MRLLIDTDAGIDDAVALMMALAHPGTTVEAITTTYGNVALEKVNRNVLTVLEVMGCPGVPVYAGSSQPLVARWAAESIFGDDGLGNYEPRPPFSKGVEPEHAALALIHMANTYPGELTLVALAPQTNIALATRLDPTFPSKIKELIIMGGAITAEGNTDNVAAEWNVYCDPEAAFITLNAFPHARLVSWETTLHHPLPIEDYNALTALPTPRAQFFAAINRVFMDPALTGRTPQHYLLPDPLAMGVALEPGLIRHSKVRHMTVELHGTHTRGQTVIDHNGRLKQSANVEIVTEIDMQVMNDLLRRALAG
ncbi:MAG: nucleoside hydrolase [Anaerolineae bacterium]|nr:nucleoside hydrolase [Anaerolineae bacterium]